MRSLAWAIGLKLADVKRMRGDTADHHVESACLARERFAIRACATRAFDAGQAQAADSTRREIIVRHRPSKNSASSAQLQCEHS